MFLFSSLSYFSFPPLPPRVLRSLSVSVVAAGTHEPATCLHFLLRGGFVRVARKGWVSERALTPVIGLSLESRLFPLASFSRSLSILLQTLDTQTRLLLQAFVSLLYGRGYGHRGFTVGPGYKEEKLTVSLGSLNCSKCGGDGSFNVFRHGNFISHLHPEAPDHDNFLHFLFIQHWNIFIFVDVTSVRNFLHVSMCFTSQCATIKVIFI
jgi:hypothetical protein